MKSIVDLGERESRLINIVKAKYSLKDRSQGLNLLINRYEECELEPQLRPEFIKEIDNTLENGKFVRSKTLPKNMV